MQFVLIDRGQVYLSGAMVKVWEMVHLFSCMALEITNELSCGLVCICSNV